MCALWQPGQEPLPHCMLPLLLPPQFSRAIYAAPLGVMVPAQLEAASGWWWVKPFAWSTWLAWGVMLLCFPLLVSTGGCVAW